ncbi:hypothetical protein M514_07012, partial [Trichuris suis]
MHTGLFLTIVALFSYVENIKAGDQQSQVLKKENAVAAVPPYKPTKTMAPHARDACAKYDCAEDHQKYKKTMTTEYYEPYIKCLNKCEP